MKHYLKKRKYLPNTVVGVPYDYFDLKYFRKPALEMAFKVNGQQITGKDLTWLLPLKH